MSLGLDILRIWEFQDEVARYCNGEPDRHKQHDLGNSMLQSHLGVASQLDFRQRIPNQLRAAWHALPRSSCIRGTRENSGKAMSSRSWPCSETESSKPRTRLALSPLLPLVHAVCKDLEQAPPGSDGGLGMGGGMGPGPMGCPGPMGGPMGGPCMGGPMGGPMGGCMGGPMGGPMGGCMGGPMGCGKGCGKGFGDKGKNAGRGPY